MGRAVIPAMMAAAQLLAAPFAAAQPGLAPAAPPPGLTQAPSDPQTGCSAALLPGIQLYPAMAPLKEDASARVDLVVGPDGRVVSARIGDGSGDAARDAALLAHVRQNWRYRPLGKDCPSARLQVRVHFPHVTCAPQPLPETQTAPDVDLQDRPRAVELAVGVAPDGSVVSASVARSSGDAALDAAALAHVKQAWRWQPYSCPAAASAVTMGSATVRFPYMVPGPPPR